MYFENHIKSWKRHLAADPTSCTKATANQFRLFLHGAAYWLMWSLRTLMPRRSSWRTAQFDTLRLRLIKLAVRVEQYRSLCDPDGGAEVDARGRLMRARAQWIAAHLALDPARHLPASGTRHALLQDLVQHLLMQGEPVLRGEKPPAAAACGAPRARHAGTTADPDPRRPAAPLRA